MNIPRSRGVDTIAPLAQAPEGLRKVLTSSGTGAWSDRVAVDEQLGSGEAGAWEARLFESERVEDDLAKQMAIRRRVHPLFAMSPTTMLSVF